jgi:hypothetical protein
MTTITIDDKRNGILLPLADIAKRLPISQAVRIRLRDFRLQFGAPLGMTLREFEDGTKTSEGLVLSPESFSTLAAADMQMIDGTIEFDLCIDGKKTRLLVECIDASLWELTSESNEVMAMVTKED